jgi:hypothetical protein
MNDEDIVGKNAFLNGKWSGTVHDFYLTLKDPVVLGISVSMGFRSRPIKGGLFTFDGKGYILDPSSKGSDWKPSKGSTVKYTRVRGKEVFAGPGWKIGRMNHLQIDTDDWRVTGIDVQVEHQLIMRDVGDYDRLGENTSTYGFKHFYADAYSFKPGKIVREMGDSGKARFLTDSGDSNIRGLGEATSKVQLPATGMKIHRSGTITLPIDPVAVEEIAISLVKGGAMETEEGRKNILRRVFEEYYSSA